MPALTAAAEALVATARTRLANAGYPADDLSDEDVWAGYIVLWQPDKGPTVRLPNARVEMELCFYSTISTNGWIGFNWFHGHPSNGETGWLHMIGYPFGDLQCRVRITVSETSPSGIRRLQGGLCSAWEGTHAVPGR